AVHGVVEQLAEAGVVDVRGGQGCLLVIPTGQQIVIVSAQDRHVGRCQACFESFHKGANGIADGLTAGGRAEGQDGRAPFHGDTPWRKGRVFCRKHPLTTDIRVGSHPSPIFSWRARTSFPVASQVSRYERCRSCVASAVTGGRSCHSQRQQT